MSSIKERNYFFFAKHFNDIDHVVPVIFSLLENGVSAERIRYICLNPMFIGSKSDPRLKLLKSKGVALEHPVNILLARIHSLIRVFYPSSPTRKILPFHFQVIYKILRSLSPLFTDIKKADSRVKEVVGKIVEDAPVSSLFVCDNGSGALNRLIVEKVKARGIPCLSLPHGIMLFNKGPGEGIDDFAGMNIFDAVVVPNQLYGDRFVRLGLYPDKKRVLGAARFCEEWMEITKGLYPVPENLKRGKSLLKVLYIVGKYDDPLEPQIATIDFLSKEEGVMPIIKLNTRGIKTAQYKAFKKLKSHYVDVQYTTQELIAWADIILTGGSSVLVDPVMRGKTVITLEYINTIPYVFDEYGVPWNVKSLQELQGAVRRVKNESSYRPYTEKECESFIKEFVYSNDEAPVLTRYNKLLSSFVSDRAGATIKVSDC